MKIANRKASFEYQIIDKFEAGVVLTGAEVKALLLGQATLDEAYVKEVNGELFLLNAHIHPYKFAQNAQTDPKRTRKLLLNKKEILTIIGKLKQGNLAMIPLSWYNKGRKIKLEIALAKGKKAWEKREALKKRDLNREAEQTLAL